MGVLASYVRAIPKYGRGGQGRSDSFPMQFVRRKQKIVCLGKFLKGREENAFFKVDLGFTIVYLHING